MAIIANIIDASVVLEIYLFC